MSRTNVTGRLNVHAPAFAGKSFWACLIAFFFCEHESSAYFLVVARLSSLLSLYRAGIFVDHRPISGLQKYQPREVAGWYHPSFVLYGEPGRPDFIRGHDLTSTCTCQHAHMLTRTHSV
jgi:hypothetical protein